MYFLLKRYLHDFHCYMSCKIADIFEISDIRDLHFLEVLQQLYNTLEFETEL